LFFDVVSRDYLDVIREVADRGYRVWMNGGPLMAAANQAGLEVTSWNETNRPDMANVVDREVSRIAQRLRPEVQTDAGKAAFDCERGDVLSRTGSGIIQSVLDLAVQQVMALESLESLRAATDLRAVVLGCDNSPTQRAIALRCRALDIPTIQLAHA